MLARGFLEKSVEFIRRFDLPSIHSKQILARLHIYARLRERRLEFGIPVFSVVDFLEAVASVFNRIIRAEQPNAHVRSVRLGAATHKHVTH